MNLRLVEDAYLNDFVRNNMDRKVRKTLGIKIPWFNKKQFYMPHPNYKDLIYLYINTVALFGDKGMVRYGK